MGVSRSRGLTAWRTTGIVKVTYLGIRSAHERVWLVERKPIWLHRAYLTRGDLEPARGNLHVCKFLRDLTNIQIRTVTAERGNFVLSAFARRTWYNSKEGRKLGREARTRRRERKKERRRTREKAREKEQLTREREKALDSMRPETNNSVLSWINTRISFLLPFTPALDNRNAKVLWNYIYTGTHAVTVCQLESQPNQSRNPLGTTQVRGAVALSGLSSRK